jgi:hypothetical protein
MEFSNFPLPPDKYYLALRFIEVADLNKNNPRFKFMSVYKNLPSLVSYRLRENVYNNKIDRINSDFNELYKMFSSGNYNFTSLKLPKNFKGKSFFEYLVSNHCLTINETRLVMVYVISKLIEQVQEQCTRFILQDYLQSIEVEKN